MPKPFNRCNTIERRGCVAPPRLSIRYLVLANDYPIFNSATISIEHVPARSLFIRYLFRRVYRPPIRFPFFLSSSSQIFGGISGDDYVMSKFSLAIPFSSISTRNIDEIEIHKNKSAAVFRNEKWGSLTRVGRKLNLVISVYVGPRSKVFSVELQNWCS